MEDEKLVGGSVSSNEKNTERKVPKKIHKAEREKLKRDHLNELFLELGRALEPSRQNNGKACILGDATRLLPDLLAWVESLRKENTNLLSESHYVTLEKSELEDEKRVLEAEIARLRGELQRRLLLQSNLVSQYTLAQPALMVPLHQGLQPNYNELQTMPKRKCPSHVRRPQARYPTPLDSWPLELGTRHHRKEPPVLVEQ